MSSTETYVEYVIRMFSVAHHVSPQRTQPNVFLTPDLQVKIADFGLSVYASGVTNNYYSLRTGNTRWIAPELMDSTSTQSPELQRERKALEERAGGNDDLMHIYRPTKPSDVYSFAWTCIEVC